MQKDPVVIVAIGRTPQGNLLGTLKDFSAPQLGSAVIKALVERATLSPEKINEVLMGCVLPAGLGQAPARQAALNAGLSPHTSCTTLNKMCGSGMKAVMFAHDILLANPERIMIAGGMESMTNSPYLIPKARAGYRFGHGTLIDSTLYDGLEDAYDPGRPMGYFAELTAKTYGFSRAAQDDYARTSFLRARKAIANKSFDQEIVPLLQKTKQGEKIIHTDERPLSVNIEKMPELPPAFAKDGTVTAGNASSVSDGAAGLLLMRQSQAEKLGCTPLAKIIAYSGYAATPSEFTTAPIHATRALLEKISWTVADVDLFEINEAFAVVAMVAMKELKIPHEKLNIHGGGCALGHPIGATGARIIVTLLSALQQQNSQRGVASLCIGGGEATALALERIS